MVLTMTEDLKLQVVVNDEVIDLRSENLQKDMLKSKKTFSRCSSQHALTVTKSTSRKIDEIHGAGLRKLATQLCKTDKITDSRNFLKNKLKSRAASADPRFRRERSPIPKVIEKKLILCRSESHTPQLSKATKTIYTHSTPVLESTECSKVLPLKKEETPVHQMDTTKQGDTIAISPPLDNEIKEPVNELKDEEKDSDKMSHITTVADYPCVVPKSLEEKWDDSKLHSEFLKNLRVSPGKPAKSTWTLPVCNKVYSMCEMCCGKKKIENGSINTYKFDAYTEDEASDFDKANKYRKIERIIRSCLLTPIFLIGCILGLCLVTSIIWLFASDFFWNILNQKETKPCKFQIFFAYLAGNVIYGINTVVQKFTSILSLQRNEFMKIHEEPSANGWFNLFNR